MEQRWTSGTKGPVRGSGERLTERLKERPAGRLDLSLPQVAGGGLAAIGAAVLASRLGVYGTVIGAGLFSVVATCGGSVFHYLFRRTGERIRDAAAEARPAGRQVPVPPHPVPPHPEAPERPAPAAGLGDGGYTPATTHGTRLRGWKRPFLAAGAAFAVAMGAITGYELISGQDLSGGTGTTVGSVVSGGGHRSAVPATPESGDGGGATAPAGDGDHSGGTERSGATGSGTDSGSGSDSGSGTEPTPTPSASPSASTAPEPPGPAATGSAHSTDRSGSSGSTDPTGAAPTPSGTGGTGTAEGHRR
ncbi:hypothetical protein AB0O07_00450 [Streptomyces sp. NPDC093085]|uniref:hypothetical protein n=1 Tax=Streptomyces sp. NPDC093085 TaxID=3155068 RepID=UPI0034341D81